MRGGINRQKRIYPYAVAVFVLFGWLLPVPPPAAESWAEGAVPPGGGESIWAAPSQAGPGLTPAAKGKKKKKGFKIPAPKQGTPAAELQAAREFVQLIVGELGKVLVDFNGEVQKSVAKNAYDAQSGAVITARIGRVEHLVEKAVNRFVAQVDKLLESAAVPGGARASAKPGGQKNKGPFGAPLKSLAGKNDNQLLAALAQLSEMESYDELCLEMLAGLQSPAGALPAKVLNAVIAAFRKDMGLIEKMVKQVSDLRFSTKGITPWKAGEVVQRAKGAYEGISRNIADGWDIEVGVRIIFNEAARTFLVNFVEGTFANPLLSCNYSGQGDLTKGVTFKTAAPEGVQCGIPDIRVDNKGRLSGEVAGFPAPGSPEYWGLRKVTVDGLLKKDGTAEVSSRTIFDEPNGGSGWFPCETGFKAGE